MIDYDNATRAEARAIAIIVQALLLLNASERRRVLCFVIEKFERHISDLVTIKPVVESETTRDV